MTLKQLNRLAQDILPSLHVYEHQVALPRDGDRPQRQRRYSLSYGNKLLCGTFHDGKWYPCRGAWLSGLRTNPHYEEKASQQSFFLGTASETQALIESLSRRHRYWAIDDHSAVNPAAVRRQARSSRGR